jgi:site-specific DNA recombinase
MIAAIYARKSTDQNLPDEAKSTHRQIDHATAYATRKGWIVDRAHVYEDDGISGAEFVKRPGFIRLMNALKPRPPFQVLIMSEESRFGREQIETAWSFKQITDGGVRVFFYLEDRERTIGTATDKVMFALTNFAAEMEREKARQRTRDAMQRRARQGHVAGGCVYGYTNVRKDGFVDRVIEPTEAGIIRRIFAAIAAGRGYARVAQALNADRIPGPRPGRGWAMTCVREMVWRDLYRGCLIYGKTRWFDKGGTKVKVRVPKDDWITVDVPALQIIDDATWQAAHARLAQTRQTYPGAPTAGRPRPRPRGERPDTGIESRYRFGGLVRCGVCQGAMHAIKRTSKRGTERVYYVCNNWRVNGSCTNGWSLPLPALDDAVLGALADDVLMPNVIDDALADAMAEAAKRHDTIDTRRRALDRDLRRIDRELGNLTDAIAGGKPPARLIERMRAREQQRADLLAQLEHIDGLRRAARPSLTPALRATVQAVLAEWDTLLRGNPSDARPVLRQLLVGRLTLTPQEGPQGRVYAIAGTATLGTLLGRAVVDLVPPG